MSRTTPAAVVHKVAVTPALTPRDGGTRPTWIPGASRGGTGSGATPLIDLPEGAKVAEPEPGATDTPSS